MALIDKFYCPTNDWGCPYWKKDGSCAMTDEGLNPVDECDEAGAFAEED